MGGARVVVVLDQMEELFTLGADGVDQAGAADLLTEVVHGGGVVLAAVRADQLANVTEVPRLARLLGGNNLLVGAPTGRELSDAIVRPAERAGLIVEDGLADEILADAQGATGVLPLVQTALLETWARRRGDVLSLAGYHEAGWRERRGRSTGRGGLRPADGSPAGRRPSDAAAVGRGG